LAFFKVQKRYQKETELIFIGLKHFHTPMLQRKQNGTFANYFQIFLLVRNVFVCFRLLRNQNRTFVFSKNDVKTKPKRFKLRQGFLKTKQNFLLFQKKFGNGPEQKLLDQIFLVLIENVLFRSRILFQKRIYWIFFGTKAAKRKLSILKERWFDIASSNNRCTEEKI
jgi:hypothetical protein